MPLMNVESFLKTVGNSLELNSPTSAKKPFLGLQLRLTKAVLSVISR